MKAQIKRQFKIGHLTSNYLPRAGGAQACIHNLANRLTEKRYEVIVMTSVRGAGGADRYKYGMVKLSPLINRMLFVNFSIGKIYLEHVLKKLQRKYGFNLWQVTVGYPLGAASVDFFNRNGIPCVLRCTGEDIQRAPALHYGYRLNKKVDAVTRRTYSKFNAVVALGEGMKNEYRSLGIPEERIAVIPNGVDCARFAIERDKGRIRKELGLDLPHKLIITVGRNHPKKGFAHIPDIIRRIMKKRSDFRWLIIGKNSGEIKARAREKGVAEYLITKEVNPGVTQKGEFELPHRRLIEYYKASDVFVFPTHIETFGKVVIEAMAAGLPVVTTDAPGVSEIVQNNENGLKCAIGDADGFAEAILKIFADNALAARLSMNALNHAKRYDWEVVTQQYLELYKRLLRLK